MCEGLVVVIIIVISSSSTLNTCVVVVDSFVIFARFSLISYSFRSLLFSSLLYYTHHTHHPAPCTLHPAPAPFSHDRTPHLSLSLRSYDRPTPLSLFSNRIFQGFLFGISGCFFLFVAKATIIAVCTRKARAIARALKEEEEALQVSVNRFLTKEEALR